MAFSTVMLEVIVLYGYTQQQAGLCGAALMLSGCLGGCMYIVDAHIITRKKKHMLTHRYYRYHWVLVKGVRPLRRDGQSVLGLLSSLVCLVDD